MNRARVSLLSLLTTALLSSGGALFADLLVTKDGATIETAGGWRVDGRQVVFTLPNGALSSIRTDEVDLDGSALATARAAEAAEAAKEPPAPVVSASILTLTEDDLAKEESAEEGAAEGEQESAEAPKSPLEIVSWEQMPMQNDEGVQLFGTVKNTGKTHLTSVTVTAILYGEEGGMLATGDAQLNRSAIPPGESANFRVEFPGLPDFTSVKFSAVARGFDSRAEPATSDELDAEPIEPGDEAQELMDEPPAEPEPDSDAAAVADYEANMGAPAPEPETAEPPPGER